MCGSWLTFLLGVLLVWPVAGCQMLNKEESDAEPAVARITIPAPEPRDGLIPVGQPAPDFEGIDQAGQPQHLAALLEKANVVLVFYPADFTPTCTKQLCAVRDDWSEFQKRNAVVLGINPAAPADHARFAGEHKFPFAVLSDPMARIAAGYGARGKNPDHPRRTVYVIRRDGRVGLAERGVVSHRRIFAALDRP